MENTEIRTQTYMVTVADWMRYTATAYYQSMVTWPYFLFYLTFILLPSAALATIDLANGKFARFAIFAICFLSFWLTVVPALKLFYVYHNTRKTPGATGARTMILTDDGVTIETDDVVISQDWSAVRAIARVGSDAYFFTRDKQAFILKPEAFTTPEQALEALTLAKAHIHNAGHKHVATFYETPHQDADLPGVKTLLFRPTFGTYLVYALPMHCRLLASPMIMVAILTCAFGLPLWLAKDALIAGDITAVPKAISNTVLSCALITLFSTVVNWFIYRRKPGFLGERRVSITAESLWSRYDNQKTKMDWRDIRCIRRYLGCIVFRVGSTGDVLVLESAFVDAVAADAFVAQARAYWKAAHGK